MPVEAGAVDAAVLDAEADPEVTSAATEVTRRSHGSKLVLSGDFISPSDSDEERRETGCEY